MAGASDHPAVLNITGWSGDRHRNVAPPDCEVAYSRSRARLGCWARTAAARQAVDEGRATSGAFLRLGLGGLHRLADSVADVECCRGRAPEQSLLIFVGINLGQQHGAPPCSAHPADVPGEARRVGLRRRSSALEVMAGSRLDSKASSPRAHRAASAAASPITHARQTRCAKCH